MVLGDAGAHYLATLKPAARRALPRQLRRKGLAALVVPRGMKAGPGWQTAGIEVWESRQSAHDAVYALRQILEQATVPAATMHGVLLSVHGVGLLLTGPAAVGKSALALDLVSRGHALVADDVVEVRRPAAGVLIGVCPMLLRGYLETRGLGVLDLRALHGPGAVRASQRIELVVNLVAGVLKGTERLSGRRGSRRILGEKLPALSLPARLGHNLAALVEAACLDQRLRDEGRDAAASLGRRQARAMKRQKPEAK